MHFSEILAKKVFKQELIKVSRGKWEGGHLSSTMATPTYDFAKIYKALHEIVNNLVHRGGGGHVLLTANGKGPLQGKYWIRYCKAVRVDSHLTNMKAKTTSMTNG